MAAAVAWRDTAGACGPACFVSGNSDGSVAPGVWDEQESGIVHETGVRQHLHAQAQERADGGWWKGVNTFRVHEYLKESVSVCMRVLVYLRSSPLPPLSVCPSLLP